MHSSLCNDDEILYCSSRLQSWGHLSFHCFGNSVTTNCLDLNEIELNLIVNRTAVIRHVVSCVRASMESVSSIRLPLGVEWEEVLGVEQQLQCCCPKTGQTFQQTSTRTITGEHSYAFFLFFLYCLLRDRWGLCSCSTQHIPLSVLQCDLLLFFFYSSS